MALINIDYKFLWESICRWSRKAGRAATRPVLILWYVMRSPTPPKKDKLAIFASLAYLVFPIDLLDAKRLPIIGWLDEPCIRLCGMANCSAYCLPKWKKTGFSSGVWIFKNGKGTDAMAQWKSHTHLTRTTLQN